MISDEKLLKELEQTNIFADVIKEQIIHEFSQLNLEQKQLLQEVFESEKILLLHYLKTLKYNTIIQPEDIKYTFSTILKEDIKIKEYKEKLELNLENMILQLETL